MDTGYPVGPDAHVETNLYTIGHSNLELDTFLNLLNTRGITAVADVRSSPYSGRFPHFSRRSLEPSLHQKAIAYVFLGDQLGGRPTSVNLYHPEGWADYERIRATDVFKQGIARLFVGCQQYRIALLCGEEDPLDCHRGLMITPALLERGCPPTHIRRNGVLESTASFEQRLQQATGIGGLFRESLSEAYRIMNRKKAFRLATPETGSS